MVFTMVDAPKKPTQEEIAAFYKLKSQVEKGKFLDENPHLQVLFPRVNYPGAENVSKPQSN